MLRLNISSRGGSRGASGEEGYDPDAFVMEWTVEDSDQITLYMSNAGNDYVVDWGDGSEITTVTTATTPSHTYTTGGTYYVQVLGTAPTISFDNQTNVDLLTAIVQWGDLSTVGILRFRSCSIASLPDGPITGMNGVTSMDGCFQSNELTTIPSGLLDNMTSVTNLAFTFALNSITAIPAGLLDNNTLVTTMFSTFQGNSITSIPAGLLDSLTVLSSVRSAFNNNGITTIPGSFFDNNTAITNCDATFGTNALTAIPADIFDQSNSITNFNGCFASNTGITGNVPELWLRNPNPPNYDTGSPSGANCFAQASSATNYGDIPDHWK